MAAYDEAELEPMRLRLQRRRREIQANSRATLREIAELKNQERAPEFEEAAQTESADYTLGLLFDQQRRELDRIDAAFQRMDQGTFGECIDCGQRISKDRLRAMPYAIRCGEDAHLFELAHRGANASPSL